MYPDGRPHFLIDHGCLEAHILSRIRHQCIRGAHSGRELLVLVKCQTLALRATQSSVTLSRQPSYIVSLTGTNVCLDHPQYCHGPIIIPDSFVLQAHVKHRTFVGPGCMQLSGGWMYINTFMEGQLGSKLYPVPPVHTYKYINTHTQN